MSDFKKPQGCCGLRLFFVLCRNWNFDDYLAVVLGKFVVAARLVSVAGEHDIEHARADRQRRRFSRVEIVVMLRIGLGRIQLLNVRPCHALAAGDAVLQIDVFFMGFQSNGIKLTVTFS